MPLGMKKFKLQPCAAMLDEAMLPCNSSEGFLENQADAKCTQVSKNNSRRVGFDWTDRSILRVFYLIPIDSEY